MPGSLNLMALVDKIDQSGTRLAFVDSLQIGLRDCYLTSTVRYLNWAGE
jgi:hypothetical protein